MLSTDSQTLVSADKLGWVLHPSYTNEGKTFYITTKQGDFCMLQMVYSTMSWSPSVQLTARFCSRQGEKTEEGFSCYGTSMYLDKSKQSAKCDQMSINLLQRDPIEYVVSFDSPKLKVQITVSATPDMLIELVDGSKVNFGTNENSGFVSTVLVPRAQVSGSFIVNGTLVDAQGYCFFSHSMHHYPQYIKRWDMINMQCDDASIVVYQFQMPKDQGYAVDKVTKVCIIKDGKPFLITLDGCIEHLNSSYDNFSGYNVPLELQFNCKGPSEFGEASVNFKTELGKEMDKVDLLASLPFVLRKVIQTLFTNPFAYQWIQDSTMTLETESGPIEFKGKLFVETVFLQ